MANVLSYKGINKPSGRVETALDYLMRSEYASAGVAEYLTGQSPYDNIFKAAWKGLSGKRRMSYIELTGNVPVGLIMGIALDPITWLPAGLLGKAVKATRIPKYLNLATINMGRRFPETIGKAIDAGRYAKSMFVGGPLSGFKYAAKYDDALDSLKVFRVGDDVIQSLVEGTADVKAIRNGLYGTLYKTGKVTRDQFVEINGALRKVSGMNQLARDLYDLTGAMGYEGMVRADALVKKARAIHKLPKGKELSILDLVEKSTVEVADGVWSVSEQGLNLFRKAGLSDDFINSTIRKHSQRIPIKMRVEGGGLVDYVGEIGSHLDYIAKNIDRPLIHELAEFEPLLDAALKKMHPNLAGLAKNYMDTYTEIVAEAQKLGMLPKRMMQNFADTMGINYLPHILISDNMDFINKQGIRIKKTFMARMDKTLGEYKTTLKASGMADELIEANVTKFTEAIKKIANSALKESLEGTDPLMKIMAEATEIAKEFPQVRMALASFRKQLQSIQSFRKVMGTINEVNKVAKKAIYETNFAELIYNHQMRIKTAIHYHNFLKKTADTMPDMVRLFDKTKHIPGDFVKFSDPMLGTFLISNKFDDTFKMLVGISRGTDPGWRQFVRAFDKGTNVWKYTTLIPFGKFHLRNFMSEMMLNTLAGMPLTAQKHYNRAAKLWYDANKLHIPSAVDEYQKFAKIKIIRSGFQASVLSKNPALVGRDIISKARRFPVGGTMLRGMEQIGNFAEDVPRMALYFFGKDKGAAWLAKKGFKGERGLLSYVRKFHPVYDEFTQFEQKVMRRVLPFYSWSRFNMPLHVEMFLHNPKHYVNLEKGRRAITEIAGGKLPDDITPEWIKDSVAIGISARPGKRNYLIMKNWHPAADLVDLTSLDAMRKKFVNMLHPIKGVAEVIWGYDTFRGRKMPSVPGGKEEFFGMRLSPRVTHLFKSIRSVNEINRFWWGTDDPYWMRTIYAFAGRNYEIDVRKAREQLYYDSGKALKEISTGISNAKYHKDYDTMRRLQKDARTLEQTMKQYKPKGK